MKEIIIILGVLLYGISCKSQVTISSISTTPVTCYGDCNGTVTVSATSAMPPLEYSMDGTNYQSSNVFNGVCAGTYLVYVRDGMAITSSQMTTVNSPDELLMNVMTIEFIQCFGGTGNIWQTVSGGTTPYTFTGTDSPTSEHLTGVGPGSYTLQVQDANGCIATQTYDLTEPDEVIVTLDVIGNVTCNGGSDGTITVGSYGGDGGTHSYSWSSGHTGSSISGLSAASYTVTATDGNGCTGSATYIVSEPDAISINYLGYPFLNCYGDATAELYAEVSGGNGGYNYSWSNGSSANPIESLPSGNYSVEVTDVLGCIQQGSTITIADPDQITGTVSEVTPISCPGGNDGVLVVNATGGTGALTYEWNSDQTTGITNNAGHDGYNGVEVTDQNNCFVNIGITLTSPDNIFATFTATDINCHGICDGTLTASVTGGTAPYSYQWDASAGNQTTVTATNLCENAISGLEYFVVITDANGCIGEGYPLQEGVSISEPDTLAVSVSSINTTCFAANGSSVASPSGGTAPYSYSWSSGSSTVSESNLPQGDFVFTVTDNNGCEATDTAHIGVDVIPIDVCVVTVDSTSTKNVIVWEKPIGTGISHFNIYRDVVGTYSLVTSVPYDSLSQFTDNTGGVNPQVTQYRYKISVVDSCGNESALSDYHQTIHLNAPNLVGNTADLVWQAYGGFTSNYYYRILRDSTGLNNWEVVDSVSSTTLVFTDIAVPNTANISYLVQIATPNTCSATKAQDHNTTRSNRHIIPGPGATGIEINIENSINVLPNPSKGLFTVNVKSENWSYSLFDMSGKLIANENVFETNKDVDIQTFESGIYLMKINLEGSSVYKKIIKE